MSVARGQFKARRGMAIVAVLVCLFVVATLALASVQAHVGRLRQERRALIRAQAEWLAESALARAVALVRTQPEYLGETWNVVAEELGGNAALPPDAGGAATVVVERSDDGEWATVQVTARYPADASPELGTSTESAAAARQVKVQLSPHEPARPGPSPAENAGR